MSKTLSYNSPVSILQISHLSKTFGGQLVLNALSLDIAAHEIVCLLGPSGCGKTTLLRLIAGLETPDSGALIFDGQDLRSIPVHQRNFGLMFQDFALFPHKNVWDNVIFGLRMQHLPADQIERLGHQALELVGLIGFEKRDVHQLSGGERQRVALARSLAPQPKLLMLDEPLGALDRHLREELMIELRRILQAAQLTAIYVTHDQSEAFAVADRVAVLNAGRLEQLDTPAAVYAQPASEFVARFLGMPNILTGTVLSYAAGVAAVDTPLGHWSLAAPRPVAVSQSVTLRIRSDAATLAAAVLREPAGTPSVTVLRGAVREVSFRGRTRRVVVHVNGIDLEFDVDARTAVPPPGDHVQVALPTGSILIL